MVKAKLTDLKYGRIQVFDLYLDIGVITNLNLIDGLSGERIIGIYKRRFEAGDNTKSYVIDGRFLFEEI